jgi:hypothetical protein
MDDRNTCDLLRSGDDVPNRGNHSLVQVFLPAKPERLNRLSWDDDNI